MSVLLVLLHPCYQPKRLSFHDLDKDQIMGVKEMTTISPKFS